MASLEQTNKDLLSRRSVGVSLMDIEPTALLELYELYFDPMFEPFRFHAGTSNFKKSIIWNGNDYIPSAIDVQGFETNMFGRLPRPILTVSNVDYAISNILRQTSDLRNAKLSRIKIFLKHIDAQNFEGNENPFGNPDPNSYISKEKYIFSQKLVENKTLIQFELITPFDMQSLETATRSIYGRYCYWQYRGSGCNYQGDLVCKENDQPFSQNPTSFLKNPTTKKLILIKFEEVIKKYTWNSNEIYYDVGDIVCVPNVDLNGFKDPAYSWFVCVEKHKSSIQQVPNASPFWEKDECSKTLQGCKKRFSSIDTGLFKYQITNDQNVSFGILPFGGFPGTDKFRYE